MRLRPEDLSPLLRGEAFQPTREALRFHMPHQTMACAERRGPYKLVHFFSGRTELYDLSTDPGESKESQGEDDPAGGGGGFPQPFGGQEIHRRRP